MTDVLVVDDEPDIALICRLALTLAGFDVEACENGTDALAFLADRTPDVVLLDLRLPDLSGWDILERLRGDGRLDELRVVLFSAHAGVAQRALDEGCVSFLPKPFTPDDLVANVTAAAERRVS